LFARHNTICRIGDLPKGNVLIKVYYSALNYKDILSCTGNKGVTRVYPHTPGIDAAGIVVASDPVQYTAGDRVIITGNDLGMSHWGGWSEYICVPDTWIIRLPKNMTMRESMMYGTAGLTAA
jgi:alcohol dehydrogenase